MTNYFTTSDRLDDLMYGVREHAMRKAHGLVRKEQQEVMSTQSADIKKILETEPLSRKDVYRMRELTVFDDEEFIDNAYRAVLRRTADPSGKDAYLGKLRKGQLSKVGILGRLRFSMEGRKRSVRVRGLMFPFLMEIMGKVYIFGPLIQLLTTALLSPWIISDLRKQAARLAARQTLLINCLDTGKGDVCEKQADCEKDGNYNLNNSVSHESHHVHSDIASR